MNTLTHDNLPASFESICTESIDPSSYSIRVRFDRLLSLLQKYHATAKQRHALSQLSDDQLKDIGITRVDALQEAGKPFWK
jgi:uncharacterized protein YjiS (DUF1127 family)